MVSLDVSDTDSFGDLTPNTLLASPSTRSLPNFGSYQVSAPGGLFPVGNSGNTAMSTILADDVMTFTFSDPNIFAVGGFIFGTDGPGEYFAFSGSDFITVIVTDSDGATSTVTLNSATQTTFVGFRSTSPIVSLSVDTTYTSTTFYPTLDDLVVAPSVIFPGE